MAGQLAFPTTINTPSANDLRTQGASEGDPIAMILGTQRTTGSLIWRSDVSKSSNGGKGSPQLSTYSYKQSFAMQLCGNEIFSIRKIWMDGQLMYDRSVGVTNDVRSASDWLAAQMTVYTGTEDQMPDPTMEAWLGAGNVPAHRGCAYVVFTDFDITQYGPRIPLCEFEVVQVGTGGNTTQEFLSPPIIDPWVEGNDPRPASVSYFNGKGAPGELSDLIGPNAFYMSWSYGPLPDSSTFYPRKPYGIYIAESRAGSAFGFGHPWTPYDPATLNKPYPGDAVQLVVGFNRYQPQGGFGLDPFTHLGSQYEIAMYALGDFAWNQPAIWSGGSLFAFTVTKNSAGAAVFDPDIPGWVCHMPPSPDPFAPVYGAPGFQGAGVARLAAHTPVHEPPECAENWPVMASFCSDFAITVQRKPRAPTDRCSGKPMIPGTDYCVIDGQVEAAQHWNWEAGSGFLQLLDAKYHDVTRALDVPNDNEVGSYWDGTWNTTSVTMQEYQYYPCGPVIRTTDPNNHEEWWTEQYNAALTAGKVPAGLVYGVDYPFSPTGAYVAEIATDGINPTPITVADAVRFICNVVGIPDGQLDVSQLTDQLWGYGIKRLCTGRDALGPLMNYGLFDSAEPNGILAFNKRGGDPQFEHTDDDLGAVELTPGTASRDSSTSRLQIQRPDLYELPEFVRVRYTDIGNDAQPGLQPSPHRIFTSAVGPMDVDLSAISMTSDQAAQLADIHLRAIYISAEKYQYTTGSDWLPIALGLPPGNLTANGLKRRLRVTGIDYSAPGLIQVRAERDEQNCYTSIAIGNGAPLQGTTDNRPSINGPSAILPLDIPALRTQDNSAGYYAAIYGYMANWPGASIYRSVDGGQTFSELETATKESTVGQLLNVLGSWGPGSIDYVNTLRLKLLAGAPPVSISRTALWNQGNYAAVGAPGRWEIIQFQNAALQGDGSYLLSGLLLRGQLGTEAYIGTHQVGDMFVLLVGNLLRLDDSLSFKGIQEQLRAVTSGLAVQTADTATITPAEVCLQPLSPRFFAGGRTSTGDVLLKWGRRDRFANDLVDGSDIPMSETSESYQVAIYNPYTGQEIRTLTVSTPNATYTAAQQVADFGALQPTVYAGVFQISAAVGRGDGAFRAI